jgi:signal transduction histidine kinase
MFRRFRLVYLIPVTAFGIVAGALWYSNSLVHELALQEERRVAFFARALNFLAANDNCEATFLFENLIKVNDSAQVISVPSIQTDAKGKPISDNLSLPPGLSPEAHRRIVLQELEAMKATNDHPPLRIEFAAGQYNYIYYRESDLVRKLRFYPYITLIIIVLFIGIVFIGFYQAQRSEQNKVWVGLARETAHQLGTPISGLIGWLALLEMKYTGKADQEILGNIRHDIEHLQNIAERFSKIGSEPELQPQPLTPILEKALEYVRTRAGRSGRIKIEMHDKIPPGTLVGLNPLLFEWVIENLLKNALDALPEQTGKIILRAELRENQVIIEVEDTGKGIAPAHLKKVFAPGFTTKKRGWGLGLSLSRRIVENYHKGKIYVRRSELGKGTTFRIILQVAKVKS